MKRYSQTIIKSKICDVIYTIIHLPKKTKLNLPFSYGNGTEFTEFWSKHYDSIVLYLELNDSVIGCAYVTFAIETFERRRGRRINKRFYNWLSLWIRKEYRKTGLGPELLSILEWHLPVNCVIECEYYIAGYVQRHLPNTTVFLESNDKTQNWYYQFYVFIFQTYDIMISINTLGLAMTTMIKQQFDNDKQRKDCFLCCIAMLLHLSYDEAWNIAGDMQPVFATTARGPSGTAECERLLGKFGLNKADKDYQVLFMLPEYATTGFLRNVLWGRKVFAQVTSKNFSGEQHLVYWDGTDLFDPSNMRTYKWEEVEPIYLWIFDEDEIALRKRHS